MSNVTINTTQGVKEPEIKDIETPVTPPVITAEDLAAMKDIAAYLKSNPNFDLNSINIKASVSSVPKPAITDFSNIREEDIYDHDGIEAKAFMSSDILKADLKDPNYVARWVNKNPQRMGHMIATGFIYCNENDLRNALDQQVAKDAEGHYAYNDVVLMKIHKSLYYPALKAAQMRADNATRQVKAGEAGKIEAEKFMQREGGTDYATAVREGKVSFYSPSVGA